MNDMRVAIIPKSDQMNADDLIAGPRTITISDVLISPGTEQPVNIRFEGDNNKPWRPCKSMSRLLVAAWGPDAKEYKGRSVTLYRDPTVKWGGAEVGGIRISHMSHIESDLVMSLTATKGKRSPVRVKPLKVEEARFDIRKWAADLKAKLGDFADEASLDEAYGAHKDDLSEAARKFMDDAVSARKDELNRVDDGFPGDK